MPRAGVAVTPQRCYSRARCQRVSAARHAQRTARAVANREPPIQYIKGTREACHARAPSLTYARYKTDPPRLCSDLTTDLMTPAREMFVRAKGVMPRQQNAPQQHLRAKPRASRMLSWLLRGVAVRRTVAPALQAAAQAYAARASRCCTHRQA